LDCSLLKPVNPSANLAGKKTMPIATGDRVQFSYHVCLADGRDVESSSGEDAVVILGDGSLPSVLECSLLGRTTGDRFHVDVNKIEGAFGVADPDNRQAIPLSQFKDKLDASPGSLVEFQLPDGEPVAGRVIEVKSDKVIIDFNHPLIGKDVRYSIRITGWQSLGPSI